MWPSLLVVVVLGLLAFVGWAGGRLILTGSALIAEARLPVGRERTLGGTGASLRDAESAVVAAEDGLRSVLRRGWWEVVGLGDRALRQRELVHACGELIRAQRTMAAVHRRTPFLALDPGDEIAWVEDPMRALVLRRDWLGWFALMLAPPPIRQLYVLVSLRRAVVPLLEKATELQDQLVAIRRSGVWSLHDRAAA